MTLIHLTLKIKKTLHYLPSLIQFLFNSKTSLTQVFFKMFASGIIQILGGILNIYSFFQLLISSYSE